MAASLKIHWLYQRYARMWHPSHDGNVMLFFISVR